MTPPINTPIPPVNVPVNTPQKPGGGGAPAPGDASTRRIVNALTSPELDITEVVDRSRIQFFLTNMAEQINTSRAHFAKQQGGPPKTVIDLSDWIAQIIIETTAQGASLLQVHVIDPAWMLLRRDSKGVCFIDSDNQGYLWPPIEVTFPPDVSDQKWRLAALDASTDLTQANITLTFEDKIVAELREHSAQEPGAVQFSGPNETRAHFIERLVRFASEHPSFTGESRIRFQSLLPRADFTQADLASTQTSPLPLPKSAQHRDVKHNPPKNIKVPTHPVPGLALPAGANLPAEGPIISIEGGLDLFIGPAGSPNPPSASSPPPPINPPGLGSIR